MARIARAERVARMAQVAISTSSDGGFSSHAVWVARLWLRRFRTYRTVWARPALIRSVQVAGLANLFPLTTPQPAPSLNPTPINKTTTSLPEQPFEGLPLVSAVRGWLVIHLCSSYRLVVVRWGTTTHHPTQPELDHTHNPPHPTPSYHTRYGSVLLGSGLLLLNLQKEANVPPTVVQSAIALLAPGGFLGNVVLIGSITKFEPNSDEDQVSSLRGGEGRHQTTPAPDTYPNPSLLYPSFFNSDRTGYRCREHARISKVHLAV